MVKKNQLMEHPTVKRSKCHLGYRSRGLMLQMPASMMVWRYISAHPDVLHVFGGSQFLLLLFPVAFFWVLV